MMESAVQYEFGDSVATITMDDGKLNVLSMDMLNQLNQALDRAVEDEAVVVLRGRDGVFSAGFDLPTLRAGGPAALAMLRAGFDLAERVLSFPRPVVIACSGHAIAMGVFLLLSGDYRVGALGPYKISANEVAIGVTMPRAAVEILRQRLTPAHFNRATLLAETFTPADAVQAGFLDRTLPPTDLEAVTSNIATDMAQLDKSAHKATKLRARRPVLQAIRGAIEADVGAFVQEWTINASAT